MHAPPREIPFPLSTAPGARPQESAGRLINCYAEPLGETGPAKAVWRRAPGLTAFSADTGFTGFRGGILVNNLYYAAFANRLVTLDMSANITTVGTLGGTSKVFFARNNLTPTPQIACVTESGAFVVTASSVSSWPDPNLPAPNSVCFQDGYFFFTIGDRRCFATGLNATSVNALCFVTAEAKSQDALIRAIPYNGLLFLCATASIEVWQDTANAAPAFPYSRVFVIQRGLAQATAIAGFEDGFGNALIWVGDDFSVYRLDGQQPSKISPPDLDRLIKAAVLAGVTLEAFVYVHAAHPIWTLSSPSWTWEFDLGTQRWRERLSGTQVGARWRATGNSQLAFGKWLVGDQSSGRILFVDDTAFTEVGATQLFRIESGPVQNFPDRMRVARADFDFVTGVGVASGTDPIQTNPMVEISWSDDGGVTFGNPLIRALGRQQKSKTRVNVTNTGRAGPQGRRWRLDVSDPVYVGLIGATQGATLASY